MTKHHALARRRPCGERHHTLPAETRAHGCASPHVSNNHPSQN
jgi:hypothetical protein